VGPDRIKLLTGELNPLAGQVNKNGRLRVCVDNHIDFVVALIATSGYFSQHHVDTLTPTMTPVQFLASKFPGKSEQEYRAHLGNFQISGITG
jgi:ATP-binding cassette, subfamily F, member 3